MPSSQQYVTTSGIQFRQCPFITEFNSQVVRRLIDFLIRRRHGLAGYDELYDALMITFWQETAYELIQNTAEAPVWTTMLIHEPGWRAKSVQLKLSCEHLYAWVGVFRMGGIAIYFVRKHTELEVIAHRVRALYFTR